MDSKLTGRKPQFYATQCSRSTSLQWPDLGIEIDRVVVSHSLFWEATATESRNLQGFVGYWRQELAETRLLESSNQKNDI